jgi:hypothetical protein
MPESDIDNEQKLQQLEEFVRDLIRTVLGMDLNDE